MIIGDRAEARLVYLRAGRDVLTRHLSGRHGHFMPGSLLQSQLDILEEPNPSEDPLTVEVGPPPGSLAEEIIRRLATSVPIGTVAPRPHIDGSGHVSED
jgi:gluconate kinase